jgi:hypothetical protein
VLAWKLEAEEMCRFTRQEFLTGCRAMKVNLLLNSAWDPHSMGSWIRIRSANTDQPKKKKN